MLSFATETIIAYTCLPITIMVSRRYGKVEREFRWRKAELIFSCLSLNEMKAARVENCSCRIRQGYNLKVTYILEFRIVLHDRLLFNKGSDSSQHQPAITPSKRKMTYNRNQEWQTNTFTHKELQKSGTCIVGCTKLFFFYPIHENMTFLSNN